MDLEALQSAIREASIDGWLFYDFRRSNPIAHTVLGLPPHGLFSRRWLYYIPSTGEPAALTSAVESHVLASLPGHKLIYRTWQEYRSQLTHMLKDARRVAMEYSPENGIPYISCVDAGTVELVRLLGPDVVSSGDLAQRFEAVLSETQIASHRLAGAALQRVCVSVCDWLRGRLLADMAVNEFEMQQAVIQRMGEEHLRIDDSDLPLVAVNGNAANPHYSPSALLSSPICRGDLLLLDFSAPLTEEDSIFADYTWMVYLGTQIPGRIASLFGVISSARDAGIAFLTDRVLAQALIRGFEVDDSVRAVVTQAGYGDYFVHRTGHNIGGAMVHGNGANFDNLETHDTRLVLSNTCTSIEPGIYIPEEHIGLRTEVDVLVLPGGVEVTGIPAQTEVLPLLA